ncbi:hypothetical protein TWF281_002608 [Arthrobotrys megalospora]
MLGRWYEAVIGGLIGSMIGYAAMTFYVSYLERNGAEFSDSMNDRLKRTEYILEGFNSSAEDVIVSAALLVATGFLAGVALLYAKSFFRGNPSIIDPNMISRTMRRHPEAFDSKSVHWGKPVRTLIRN